MIEGVSIAQLRPAVKTGESNTQTREKGDAASLNVSQSAEGESDDQPLRVDLSKVGKAGESDRAEKKGSSSIEVLKKTIEQLKEKIERLERQLEKAKSEPDSEANRQRVEAIQQELQAYYAALEAANAQLLEMMQREGGTGGQINVTV